jgi:hypothetical protein
MPDYQLSLSQDLLQVEVKVMLRQTFSGPLYRDFKPYLEHMTRFLLLSDIREFVHAGHPL